jgi:hypothetical protein
MKRRLARCVLVGLLILSSLPARGTISSGPREIRLRWQYLAAPPAPDDRRRWLQLTLPDRQVVYVTDVHVRDISGDIPGLALYYDQFATSQFRLDVVGPAELIDDLRRNAKPEARAEMYAQYYQAVGRLRILMFKLRGRDDPPDEG